MAVIKSGAGTDQLTIDAVSKAARVTLYDATGNLLIPHSKATYFATGNFVPAATPTDMVTIFGSASKTVKVVSFRINMNSTAAGSAYLRLIKRATANGGGTFTAVTSVLADSADPAATAIAGHYTVNPASLGTNLGNVCHYNLASPVLVPGNFAGVVREAGFDMLQWGFSNIADQCKPITLHGGGEGLCLNGNSAALLAGQTHSWSIVWTEE
jgi:hypothetical protein